MLSLSEETLEAAPEGAVKWFDDKIGVRFIQPDGAGEDIFVHFSSIAMEGFKTLQEGQHVSFEVVQSEKGLKAANVSGL